MLSSSNYSRDEGILNTGEQIAPEIDFKTPGLKIYYHQTKGAKTHMPDGAEIQFMGGMFATANEDIKAYLDKIADKRGTMIYTKKSDNIVMEVAQAAADAAAPAGNADVNKAGHAEVTPEILKTVTTPQPRPEALPEVTKK